MTYSQILAGIQQVGFPVVIAVLFWWTIDRMTTAHLALLREHTQNETKVLGDMAITLLSIEKALAALLKDHDNGKRRTG